MIKLETERLLLIPLRQSDFSGLLKYANNRAVSRHALNIPYPYTEFNAIMRMSYIVQGFNEKSRFVFAIALKETDEFIGEISLHVKEKGVAECAYWLGESLWNNGYASEAVKRITVFGFQRCDLQTIFASCRSVNVASIRVLEKCAYVFAKSAGKVNYYRKDNHDE